MKELEQDKDYQEIHEKYQAMGKEQPPQSLDASIVQAAHLAVESSAVEKSAINKPDVNKPDVNKPAVNEQGQNQAGIDTRSVKRAWYVPVSYVAILVISLSVVMKLAIEPEMTPMLDENELLEHSEDYSTAVEQDVDAPLTTLAQLPPAKRKLTKSAPASVKQEVPGREETHQQGLNELKRTVQERQVSRNEVKMDEVIMDDVSTDKIFREKMIKEQKSDVARSGKVLSLSQIEEVKDEPATVAPVVTVMIEPVAQMSMAANSGSSIMSGITSEKALTDEPSVVGGVIENESKEITLKQQSEVKELVDLYEKKQFKELKLSLYSYRKSYPAGEKPEALPEMLLDWEKVHISQSQKK